MSKEREILQAIILKVDGLEGFGIMNIIKESKELLAQPETGAWMKTNGKPVDWGDNEYVWTHWKSGKLSLDEAWGGFTWAEITHWMPAQITEPSKPQ